MDYCEGGDMYHKIAKQRQLGTLFPQHQIVTWFVQMALAMNLGVQAGRLGYLAGIMNKKFYADASSPLEQISKLQIVL